MTFEYESLLLEELKYAEEQRYYFAGIVSSVLSGKSKVKPDEYWEDIQIKYDRWCRIAASIKSKIEAELIRKYDKEEGNEIQKETSSN